MSVIDLDREAKIALEEEEAVVAAAHKKQTDSFAATTAAAASAASGGSASAADSNAAGASSIAAPVGLSLPHLPPNSDRAMRDPSNPRVWFDITIAGEPAGRIVMELFMKEVPKSSENFRQLCTGEHVATMPAGHTKRLHYKGSSFHRIVRDFMVQGGDLQEADGLGGWSIYGRGFKDETYPPGLSHDRPFLLSMVKRGDNESSNASQFFITTAEAGHLDGRHVLFGQVLKGTDVVRDIEALAYDEFSKPNVPVLIADCGQLGAGEDDGCVVDPRDPYPAWPLDCPQGLQVQDKIAVAAVVRERGNELFKQQQWCAAADKYSKALRYIEEDFPSPAEEELMASARVPALLNRAAAFLKIAAAKKEETFSRSYCTRAMDDLEAVLKQQPDNAKAVMRKGQVLLQQGEAELALPLLAKAHKLMPQDKALAKLVADTRKSTAEQDKKQAQALKSMFA